MSVGGGAAMTGGGVGLAMVGLFIPPIFVNRLGGNEPNELMDMGSPPINKALDVSKGDQCNFLRKKGHCSQKNN